MLKCTFWYHPPLRLCWWIFFMPTRMFIEITITSFLHFLDPGLAGRRAGYGFHNACPALLAVHDSCSGFTPVLHDLLALGAVLREAVLLEVVRLDVDPPRLGLLGLRLHIFLRLVVDYQWLRCLVNRPWGDEGLLDLVERPLLGSGLSHDRPSVHDAPKLVVIHNVLAGAGLNAQPYGNIPLPSTVVDAFLVGSGLIPAHFSKG